jgi:hypothetical protein
MPLRPEKHVTGDIALNQVIDVCIRSGWACEVVHKDYGDDLLVQTSINENVDPFKIWIQVKGTKNIDRYRRKNGGYKYPLPYDHAFKLIRSKDLTIVVLWDVTRSIGYWNNPRVSIDQWEMYLGPDEIVKLRFSDDLVFDTDQAQLIGWRARIEHYAILVSHASISDFWVTELSDEASSNRNKFREQTILLAHDFLRIIGVLDDKYLDQTFLEYYENAMRNIENKGEFPDFEERRRLAAGLAMMGKLNDIAPGAGMPAMMIELMTQISAGFIVGLDDPEIQADLATE